MKTIIVSLFLCFSTQAFTSPIILRDVGVMGFASHDLFEWDASNEINLENGRLDLSNLFDHSAKGWKKGGNPKNAQNAVVWSFTNQLIDKYKTYLKAGMNASQARAELNVYYHQEVKSSFQRFTGLPFPEAGIDEKVEDLEQACMRGLHDILPAKIALYRRWRSEFDVTNALTAKTILNEKELQQTIPFYDGAYDEAYTRVKIPFTRKIINLNVIDGNFIKKFSPWTQEEMLEDLGRAGRGEIALGEVFFMPHLHELFSKGICPVGLMPKVSCY